jgi:hypothetical protein
MKMKAAKSSKLKLEPENIEEETKEPMKLNVPLSPSG